MSLDNGVPSGLVLTLTDSSATGSVVRRTVPVKCVVFVGVAWPGNARSAVRVHRTRRSVPSSAGTTWAVMVTVRGSSRKNFTGARKETFSTDPTR